MKPLMTLAKIAPRGKVFALAVPVERAGLIAFSLLAGDFRFSSRASADAMRATFPPAHRVTVVLIDEPKEQPCP
jgi:hypothetical protein